MQITRRQALCRWDEHADKDLSRADRLPPLLKRIYENRQVRSRDELAYSLKRLHPPALLKGMESAASILQAALKAQWKILVIGDYDTDGATATAVAVLGLRALGALHADYLVPNRFDHGYGLSPEIAAEALRREPNLVITVDNGIASLEGVAALRAAGVAVIITDHHLAGAHLPAANAIVNPNQPGCEFPSKNLAGVGVIFYLLLGLRAALRTSGWFGDADSAPNLAELLDLVALGTVADMVPLDYNNRILAHQGIARIRNGQCRPGIRALAEVTGRSCGSLDSSDFAFAIAPRINAAGRLDDIAMGIECLLAENHAAALEHARALHEINAQRRQIEQRMQRQALAIVTRFEHPANQHHDQCGFCLYDAEWHHGVVGLVASRLKEKFNQPTVAFAPDGAGKLRGSARSIDGLHIRDLLENIASRRAGMIEKFGGHAMAAGLTLSVDQYEDFAEEFSALVEAHFVERPRRFEILTDGELAAAECTLENADLLRFASPWGQRFPPPVFDGEFRVLAQSVVGEAHLKMTMKRVDGARSFEAIAFRHVAPGQAAVKLNKVRAAYQLQANEYRGQRSLQLLVKHMQPI